MRGASVRIASKKGRGTCRALVRIEGLCWLLGPGIGLETLKQSREFRVSVEVRHFDRLADREPVQSLGPDRPVVNFCVATEQFLKFRTKCDEAGHGTPF